MPNPIKYTTGSESLALKKGNFYIGTGDVGKGPTSTTGFYNGITPPSGGYTIYLNKATGGPSIYACANDSELISLTNTIAGTSYSTANECFNYFNTQTDKIVLNRDYEGIVTDGLLLNLDAGFTPSYPKNGTTWYDVSKTYNGTLTNGPTYNSSNDGAIVFDGVDDFVPTSLTNSTWHNIPFSFSSWFMWTGGGSQNNYGFFELGNTGGSTWGLNSVQRTNLFYFYWISSSNNGGHSCTSALIQDDVPLNITITFDGNGSSSANDLYDGTKVYMNGSIVSHSGAGSAGNYGGGKLYVGGANYRFKGEMYNFQYYNKELSSSEVLQNFNAQKGRFGL